MQTEIPSLADVERAKVVPTKDFCERFRKFCYAIKVTEADYDFEKSLRLKKILDLDNPCTIGSIIRGWGHDVCLEDFIKVRTALPRLERIVAAASPVQNPEKWLDFLANPNHNFEGRAPKDLITTSEDAEKVEKFLVTLRESAFYFHRKVIL